MVGELRQRQPRVECKDFLAFVRTHACCVCFAPAPSQAAHIRFSDAANDNVNPGVGAKPDDRKCVPLCADCHLDGPGAQHRVGNERKFWEGVGLNPFEIASNLYAEFEAIQATKPTRGKPMMAPGIEVEFVMDDNNPGVLRAPSPDKDPELYRRRKRR